MHVNIVCCGKWIITMTLTHVMSEPFYWCSFFVPVVVNLCFEDKTWNRESSFKVHLSQCYSQCGSLITRDGMVVHSITAHKIYHGSLGTRVIVSLQESAWFTRHKSYHCSLTVNGNMCHPPQERSCMVHSSQNAINSTAHPHLHTIPLFRQRRRFSSNWC